MSEIVFDAGDKPFLDWATNNPDGFVLNTIGSQGSSYWVLHRPQCRSITKYQKDQTDGAFTSRGYIKVCSTNSEDILKWSAKNRTKAIHKYCKTCHCPDIANLTPPLAKEVSTAKIYIEGTACEVTINAYERNPLVRKKCLAYHGYSCVICGLNFESVYGVVAKGFIHVHHLVPLSEIGKAYEVDPIKDLRPVCPNCHAMIHLGRKTRSIEDVKNLLEGKRSAPARDEKT